MAKLKDVWSNETPWDANLTDYLGKTITIVGLAEHSGNYGRSYLVTAYPGDQIEIDAEPLVLVTSNAVIVKALDAVQQGVNQGMDIFPLTVKVVKTRGKNFSYFELIDAE